MAKLDDPIVLWPSVPALDQVDGVALPRDRRSAASMREGHITQSINRNRTLEIAWMGGSIIIIDIMNITCHQNITCAADDAVGLQQEQRQLLAGSAFAPPSSSPVVAALATARPERSLASLLAQPCSQRWLRWRLPWQLVEEAGGLAAQVSSSGMKPCLLGPAPAGSC